MKRCALCVVQADARGGGGWLLSTNEHWNLLSSLSLPPYTVLCNTRWTRLDYAICGRSEMGLAQGIIWPAGYKVTRVPPQAASAVVPRSSRSRSLGFIPLRGPTHIPMSCTKPYSALSDYPDNLTARSLDCDVVAMGLHTVVTVAVLTF